MRLQVLKASAATLREAQAVAQRAGTMLAALSMFGYGTNNAGTMVNGRSRKNSQKFDCDGDVDMAVLGGVRGCANTRGATGKVNMLRETRTCFHCGKVGHLAADCRS